MTFIVINGQHFKISRNNPFITHGDDSQLLANNTVEIPEELGIRAVKIEKLSCSMKLITLCDLFLSIYYYNINIILGVFTSLSSFNGYLSTVYYHRSLLFCYLVYQYLQILGRFLNIIYYALILQEIKNDNSANTTYVETITKKSYYEIPLLLLFFGAQLFITYYVQYYYKLLPSKEERNRAIQYTTI